MRPHRIAAPLARRLVAALACACAVAGGLGVAAPAGAAEAGPGHAVRDPHYGDTLFHFFQDHYFTSITSLMVSQRFERVEQHADEAEVLRGGMLLSYGMPREAGAIFAQLIERGASPPVRDRAWYFLAKIRYQRGYLDEAEAAFAKIEHPLPAALEDDRQLLAANLLMARADYAGAAAMLAIFGKKTPGGHYARFNLGIAQIRAGDMARGIATLDELGKSSAENEEFRSLRDRANVAIGFAALSSDQPKQARTYLERVRLQGLQSNKALLGFGWAAVSLKDPELALVPWLELAERGIADSAGLEARIAVPYAFAELGAYGQSLSRYNDAIGAFERENTALDESIVAIRSGRLVEALAERNPGDEMGWFFAIKDLPTLPHPDHLSQVLARHDFQEAFKNYRDLRFLARNLAEWHDKLGVFDDMLQTRRKAFAERLPEVRQRASVVNLEALARRRDRVRAELEAGEQASDGVALADARQVALLNRIASVDAALKAVGGDAAVLAPLRERSRLAAGLLGWQLAQDHPARVWEAKKELTAIDGQLAHARERDAALALAQKDEPARIELFAGRIAAIDPLLATIGPKVAALSREQQGAVQDIAVAELREQKERLASYMTQARFAVAQLYDRANSGAGRKDAAGAARP